MTTKLARELMKYVDTNYREVITKLLHPWTEEGRVELKALISFLKEETGEIVSYESAKIIREMIEDDYTGFRYDPGDMVKVRISINGDAESRCVPRPLLYEWIDQRVNRWRRRRGYAEKVNGVDVLRELVMDKYGPDVQTGSLEELQAMLSVINILR